jgi:hypothetical protein
MNRTSRVFSDHCNAERTWRYIEPAQGFLPELEAKE